MTIGEVRGHIRQTRLVALSNAVRGLTVQEKQQVRDNLAVLGCGPDTTPDASCAWSPAAVGLLSDLSDIIPLTDENLYQDATEAQMYPGLDLRVRYTDRGATTKYTETQTFGILVHELRVSTVAPSS